MRLKGLLAAVLLFAPALAQELAPAALQEDFEFLVRSLEEIHPNPYAYTPKEEFQAQKDQVLAALKEPMTQLEFFKLVAPLVATVKDGHTAVHWFGGPGGYFPVSVAIFDRKIFVAQDFVAGSETIPAGAEILSINGEPTAKIVESALPYISGERPEYIVARLQYDFRIYLKLVLGDSDLFQIVAKTPAGETKTFRAPATPDSADLSFPHVRYPSAATWETVTIGDDSIDAVMEMVKAQPFHYQLIDDNTALIAIRILDYGGTFATFVEGALYDMKQKGVQNLIVDLRMCGGGSSFVGMQLIRYLTEQPFRQATAFLTKDSQRTEEFVEPAASPLAFKGDVYLLTSRRTYSAAEIMAAIIKDFKIGTIVGEETGGPANPYISAFPFTLPNSGLQVTSSEAYMIRPSGINNHDTQGVLPDYPVTPEPQDLVTGRDRVLEATLELIAQRPQTGSKGN